MSRLSVLIVLCAALLSGGCVQTAMLPAQQLDSGTTVVGASIDEPGFLYIPRVNVQVTQGIGGGDLSANLSGPPVGGGVTGRAYLSDQLNVEVQAQATALNGAAGPASGLVLVGLQQAPTPNQWYLGAQAGIVRGTGFDIGGSTSDVQTRPLVGASFGVGPFDVGTDWRMQLELETNVPVGPWEDDPPFPATRISIGFFRLFR